MAQPLDPQVVWAQCCANCEHAVACGWSHYAYLCMVEHKGEYPGCAQDNIVWGSQVCNTGEFIPRRGRDNADAGTAAGSHA